ncbi:MAG: hypothetical protein HYX78_04920 [Armatimonadetes bacterium]|nr:hypothetical protein [Armatimonadota bacterium]
MSACAETDGTLFPKGLAERKWTSFRADGFSVPVTGVVYRNGNMLPGMPLGSLGTGFISIGTDGTLDSVSTIFNAFMDARVASEKLALAQDVQYNCQMRKHVPAFRLPFLGISVEGKSTILSLSTVKGVNGVKQIDYWGHYPIADMKFDTKTPISVELRAWSPFLPGQAEESNTPGAVFELRLRNRSNEPKNGAIAFSFHGPRRVDIGVPAKVDAAEYKREPINRAFTGQVVSANANGLDYAYALGVVGQERLRFGGALDDNGEAWSRIADSLPEMQKYRPGSSVALDFSLQPRENKTVRFVLAWYAPRWISHSGNPYANMYSTRFKSAGDVAEYLAKEHSSLLNRVLAWQQVVYSEKKLPGWLQDSLINAFGLLPQQSFWMNSPDPNHWWGDKGFFCVNESLLSCPQQACIANDEFGEWPVNLLFPELGLRKLEAFKHYQKQDTGQTPSTLGPGSEPDRPWYSQQLAVDGQVYVHMVDRYRLATGDDRVLDEWYPSVKAGMKFMFTGDTDGDGLLELRGVNHYLDAWPMVGVATHVSTYWLSTLGITERMARMQGDNAFAEECRSWHSKAGKSLEQKLWNDSAGSYLLYNDTATGKKSDTVLCDQFIGNLWTGLHGLPDVIPPDRVRTVLATLERLNVRNASAGIAMAASPDGRAIEGNSGFMWDRLIVPSYSTLSAASAMVRSGDPHFEKLGLGIVHRTWEALVCRENAAWDMPSHLNSDGSRAVVGGLEYYHNTMLWTFPIAVLKEDIRAICSQGGFIYRVKEAAGRIR